MLSRNSLIIRLIDIALIILFGFITISDIKVNAQIKLPSQVKKESTQSQNLFVLVNVMPDNSFELIENELTYHFASLDSLEYKLHTMRDGYNQQNTTLHVLVQPQTDSIIQKTIDVLDVCSKLNISKNIAYDYADLGL